MKAVVYYNYGSPDVLRCEEIEKPTAGDNEVLIKVRAASVNALDWRLMRGKPLFFRLMIGGLRKPKNTRPGRDAAGQVEGVGRNITQFKPGDEVFGACPGAFAEYVCAVEDRLALKPANISFENAAAVPVAGHSPPFRVFVIRDASSEVTRFWLMARRVVWVHLRSRLPNRSGLKSLPCVVRGMWTRRDRSAQTMSLITLGKISRKVGSVTI